jgi:hypothetical protein
MKVGDLVRIKTWGNQDCPGGSVGIITSAGPHPRLPKFGHQDETWCMVECTHGKSIYIDHYCLEVISESR